MNEDLEDTLAKVSLSPHAGWCIKSSCLVRQRDGLYTIPPTEEGSGSTISVPQGIKVFVNICYDSHVPAPPQGSEDIIQHAMRGGELPGMDVQGSEWFVPVVVSHPREDSDKSGKPSLVFDCVIHTSIKERVKDPEFKAFMTELALQRIEARSDIPLSRSIGTPNIRSKGPLHPRTVMIPSSLYPVGHPNRATYDEQQATKKARKLIEEIDTPSSTVLTSTVAPKSILKKTAFETKSEGIPSDHSGTWATPAWTWSRMGTDIQFKIQIPGVTRSDIPSSVLDIEPARLLLSIPGRYSLDIDLSLSDAEIQKSATSAVAAVNSAQHLALKRKPRELDVDHAKAEWRMKEGALVVHA